MALLHLTYEWARARHIPLTALTVDHRLRAESPVEAERVKRWCMDQGIVHHTLVWTAEKPASGIPAAARNARYQLMSDWCFTHGILHLLVAHHADDQAETVQLRQDRGSHARGLSGMADVICLFGLRIVRPLLPFTKAALQDYLRDARIPWSEDPSNTSPTQARNRIRNTLTSEVVEQLRASRIRALAARHADEADLCKRLVEEVSLFPEGYALWRKPDDRMSDTSSTALLMAVLSVIGQDPDSLRWNEVSNLLSALQNGSRGRTLNGCWIKHTKSGWLIYREPARLAPAIPLIHNTVWDRRFTIECKEKLPENLRLEALGTSDFRSIEKSVDAAIRRALPRPIFSTLPAVKDLEGVVKVPHIHYERPDSSGFSIRLHFTPRLPLSPAPALWL